VRIIQARRSPHAGMGAALVACRSAQLALTAQADGEAGLAEAAEGRLHALGCADCRAFAAAITEQREVLAMLVAPMVAA
jgi:hypothetical protein